jgi:hypothetical protein
MKPSKSIHDHDCPATFRAQASPGDGTRLAEPWGALKSVQVVRIAFV